MSVEIAPTDERTTAMIRGLQPATKFVCNVRSENDVGLSPPSQHVELKTEEEGTIFQNCFLIQFHLFNLI